MWQGIFLAFTLLALPFAWTLTPGHAHAAQGAFQFRPPRALVLEPFATDLGDGATTGQIVANELTSAGYAVTVLSDQQVTVPVMFNLSRYSFIYISTHVGPLPDNDAAIATGDTRHQPYASYLANYTLAEMKISHGGALKYFDAVTGLFIHRYVGTFSPHTIVFLNSCNALDMPLFWHYLQRSGVGTLISWHHHVTANDSDRAAEVMLGAMAKGQSVSQALATTKAAGAATSVIKNKTGTLNFMGDGSNKMWHGTVAFPPILSRGPQRITVLPQ